jgi:predicted dehydrogenase
VTVNVAVVGLGHWGPNLARNIAGLPGATLHTLCDADPRRLAKFAAQYPAARVQSDVSQVLEDGQVDAVMIATPVHTHYELAAAALRAGKHVLVEKPLAQTSAQCRELMALAGERGLVLMVGHVFLYNAAVRKVKEYIQSGELGDLYYVYSQRLNLGIIRQDVNALWNFAPHDISILGYWLDAVPQRVSARGFAYIQPGIEDVVFMTLEFASGVAANVHISWLDPNKVRRMTVVGSKKMIVFDDVSPEARIVLYDRGVTKQVTAAKGIGSYRDFGEFQLLLRAGDVLIPRIDFSEPLRLECQDLVDAIVTGKPPLSDGENGLRVVQALEAAQESMGCGCAVELAGRSVGSPVGR